MKLGEYGSLSFEERHKIYVDHKCDLPCNDDRAAKMDRVQWLKKEFYFGPAKPKRVLDVGCHDGFVTRWMANDADLSKLVGLEPGHDPFQRALEWIAQYPQEAQAKVEYVNAGYHEVADMGKFDWAVCFEVIEHFHPDEVADILRFCHRHADATYFCTPNADGQWGFSNPDPHHLTLFTRGALAEFLRDHWPDKYFNLTWHEYYDNCPHLLCKVERMNR